MRLYQQNFHQRVGNLELLLLDLLWFLDLDLAVVDLVVVEPSFLVLKRAEFAVDLLRIVIIAVLLDDLLARDGVIHQHVARELEPVRDAAVLVWDVPLHEHLFCEISMACTYSRLQKRYVGNQAWLNLESGKLVQC